jgi:sugar phosphate isomerase/epimerase
MKIGIYASMFGKDKPPTLESVESYIDHAYSLKVDLIDFRRNRGFEADNTDYLFAIKLRCLGYGLSIGYLASQGHFKGTDEDLQSKIAIAKEDIDISLFLGAPMIRLFTGPPLEDHGDQQREIRCFQEVCDYGATKGIAVGLQNHPSTGDDIVRIMEETERDNFSMILDTGQWVGSPSQNKGVPDPAHDTYAYMAQTAKYATHVRAKFYKIDSGREEWLDYSRIVPILAEAGFNGALSVVFEGKDANTTDDKETMRLAVNHLRNLVAAL